MTLAQLQKLLRAVDPAVVLVSPRILERVLRDEYGLPNLYWNLPHPRSHVCDRQTLFRHAEQADLELEPDQLLPDTVILLTRPDAEVLSDLERQPVLLKYWRRLFHARVHIALEAGARLGDDAVRARVEQIGRTEFEEIKAVLVEDRYLLPEADERRTFVEFAAVYLELRYFAANLLPNVFPGIRDPGKVEALLGQDVDAAALFAKTRLAGAPDPVMAVQRRVEESHEPYWNLVRAAQRAANEGNSVRAAILRMRASRIAPAALTLPTRREAEADLARLTTQLGEALGFGEAEAADWLRHLTLLLDKADQGARPTEARVLYDLQSVTLDHLREIYTLDLVEYITSLGKRPLKRPLPSQRLVRIVKHLRGALQKLGAVRLSDTDRDELTRLVQTALDRSEENLRARFGPVLVTALEDVGLKPQTPVERAAFDKMVAEMLDRIRAYGFLTFAELRDTISRNQLKLPDVREPEDFLHGDPLIRLDRRLASLLAGVYRPGEFYERLLERGTSPLFGTWWGRWFSRNVAAPFLAAWVILVLLGVIINEVEHYLFDSDVLRVIGLVLMGPLDPNHDADGNLVVADPPSDRWHVVLLLGLGFFLLALSHSAALRERCVDALVAVGRGLRWLCWDVPRRLLPLDTLRRLTETWVFQLLHLYLLLPGFLTLLVIALWPALREAWSGHAWVAVFLLSAAALNTRLGRSMVEATRDALVHTADMVRAGLIVGLVRLVGQAFKQFSEAIEFVLFRVDEWLRFRSGDGAVSLVVRTVLGAVWLPVSFLVRFYMVVLIEPGINPLKLPISILGGKLLLPFLPAIASFLRSVLAEVMPEWLAYPVVMFHLFWLPDVFGFLAWETKENWRLYRSNRPKTLGPVAVGNHGETVRGLLQPGFHSGTVPHLYARLRQAERQAVKTRNWQAARALRLDVEGVAAATYRFLARTLVALLRESASWKDQPVEAGEIHLATNRIRFTMKHAGYPAEPLEFEIEHHHGWLVAGICAPGWLARVGAEQRRAFGTCLAAFYKLADVDLVREQMLAHYAGQIAAARLTADGLQVWWDIHGEPVDYPLRERIDHPERGELVRKLVFARTPVTWDEWVACWQADQEGKGHPGLPGVGELVLPPSCADRPAAPPEPVTPSVATDGAQVEASPVR
jgi:hypothetical protein